MDWIYNKKVKSLNWSNRMSYKRSISEGLSICEYKDEKAKDEFDTFYREFESSVKNNLGVSNGI